MSKNSEDNKMLNPNTLPTTSVGLKRLAQKEFAKKTKRANASTNYKTGDPSEKVWDNYQLTKELKREFKELCAKENIIASKYLRACIRLLIKKKGDVKKALSAVEKLDTSKLEE
jgi:hypothetical protein